MKDIQSLRDDRRINIRKVGVKTISYPVTVLDKAHRLQHTVATVNMYVNLPHRFKGTHMSRFIEILNQFHGEITIRNFHRILEKMKQRLDAEAAHMELEFPYFLQTAASSGSLGVERYQCRMHGSLQESSELTLEIEVPLAQRPPHEEAQGATPRCVGRWGSAQVAVRFKKFIWIEDLIHLVEKGLSAEQNALRSPESVCRAIGAVLSENPALRWFKIVVDNLTEGYATFASLEGPQK